MSDDLIEQINAVFGRVELGDGLSLHQARAMDRLQPPEDVLEARPLDREDRWQEISDGKVEEFHYALTFMDPEGLRFHLPRFMVFALEHPGLDSPAIDAAVYACDFGDEMDQDVVAQFNAMSRTQMKTIAGFLAHITESSDKDYDTMVAAIALESFWYQFLEEPGAQPAGKP
ncbi:hypothetical protein BH23ACT12_BH23ACT12_02140 [soil metagenome]